MVYGKEKAKELSKKYYRPDHCPNVVTGCVNSETWYGNLLSFQRMADINLRKCNC